MLREISQGKHNTKKKLRKMNYKKSETRTRKSFHYACTGYRNGNNAMTQEHKKSFSLILISVKENLNHCQI